MPKISALPELATPADDDELVLNDDSASTTKKITIANFRLWLQGLVGWITTPMLADKAVTGVKQGEPVAFSAHTLSAIALGTAQWNEIIFGTESYDFGGNYDHTTGVFTAPYDGVYHFHARSNFATGNERIIVSLWDDEDTPVEMIRGLDIEHQESSPAFNFRSAEVNGDLLMSAGDELKVRIYCDDGLDTGTGPRSTSFAGFLVGRTD